MQQVTGGLDPTPPKPGIVALLLVPHALLALSAALSFLLARRDRRHKPVAIGLAVISGAGLTRLAMDGLLSAPGPYAGWMRALFHVDQALLVAGVAALPWVATEVLVAAERIRYAIWWVLASVYVGAIGGLTTGYPELRGDALRRVYLAAELAALFVCALAIVSWVRRSRSPARIIARAVANGFAEGLAASDSDSPVTTRDAPFPPGPGTSPRWYTAATVLVLVLGDAALLFVGAWPHGLFGAAYVVQQGGLLALYALVVGVHVVALRLAGKP